MLLHSLQTEVKDGWFTDASVKCIDGKWKYRAVALNIQTGMEVVEEGMGSAQVRELKAALLALKEKAKIIYVDSYSFWAGATQCLCQWEALDWQVNGKEVWQKDDWKWLLSQAQSQQIHTGCVKTHGSDQAL